MLLQGLNLCGLQVVAILWFDVFFLDVHHLRWRRGGVLVGELPTSTQSVRTHYGQRPHHHIASFTNTTHSDASTWCIYYYIYVYHIWPLIAILLLVFINNYIYWFNQYSSKVRTSISYLCFHIVVIKLLQAVVGAVCPVGLNIFPVIFLDMQW